MPPVAPERTDSFPLIVTFRRDTRPHPVQHRARRDLDGSYRIRRAPGRRYRREALHVVAVAPEQQRGAGLLALPVLFGTLALLIVIGVGASWLAMRFG